jgi:hypothetical protein
MSAMADSFVEYALNPNLDEAGAYTVCRLIDTVGCLIRDNWDWNWLDRGRKEFKSLIEPLLVRDAWPVLKGEQWLSLQTYRSEDARVACLDALGYLPGLRWLAILGNAIEDLDPLQELKGLRYLNCSRNQIRALNSLEGLPELAELHIAGNPLGSLEAIDRLPSLRDLYVGVSQVPLLSHRLSPQTMLALIVCAETHEDDEFFQNFEGFPEMPVLQRLDTTGVADLKGIERYPSLRDLELRNGSFASLESLRGLGCLTHLRIDSSQPLDLEPVHKLYALRSLHVHCPAASNVSQLSGLPVLHDLSIKSHEGNPDPLASRLARELTSWDSEFQAEDGRKTPSLNLEEVDQATFDFYDHDPYGVQGDANLGMLCSERGWLMKQIESALTVFFKEDHDLAFPGVGGMRRSEQVVALSRVAYEAFREVVTSVQTVLCECRNPWIVCYQSQLDEGPDADDLPDDTEDFIVWIYPDKIQVAEKHASVVKRLLEW